MGKFLLPIVLKIGPDFSGANPVRLIPPKPINNRSKTEKPVKNRGWNLYTLYEQLTIFFNECYNLHIKRFNLNVTFKTLGVLPLKKKKDFRGFIFWRQTIWDFCGFFYFFFYYQFYCSISIILKKYFFIFYTWFFINPALNRNITSI